VRRSIAVVHNILLNLRRSMLRNIPDMKERGKILKLCALVKVR
jgi:hypothetical protein